MGIENAQRETPPIDTVDQFVVEHVIPDKLMGKQRATLIEDFCEQNGFNGNLARGINHLVTKFDRVKRPKDLRELLSFVLWLRGNAPKNLFNKGSIVYLADKETALPQMIASMKENYALWTKLFGKDLFGNAEKESAERRVYKTWLPLDGYYLSLVGGSGSGSFSIDLGIGYDEKHSHQELRGQIWRVGVDIEVLPSGEHVFRIIRSGTGLKHGGDEVRAKDHKDIRSTFLDEYMISPQRLLLFLAMEMAYELDFNMIKGLSTQGAMELSLLGRSKTPIDYTASMVDVGFKGREGNWHEIHDLQNNFYETLTGSGYDDGMRPHEVKGFDMILKAFNQLRQNDGTNGGIQLSVDDAKLEHAWKAYAELHDQRKDRPRNRK